MRRRFSVEAPACHVSIAILWSSNFSRLGGGARAIATPLLRRLRCRERLADGLSGVVPTPCSMPTTASASGEGTMASINGEGTMESTGGEAMMASAGGEATMASFGGEATMASFGGEAMMAP